MSEYLIESALLTHGLASISDDRLRSAWHNGWNIAWIEEGQLRIGGIDEFCRFREKAAGLRRINYYNYDKSLAERISGPLTASGTMRACEETGAVLTVTCGIGGLKDGQPVTKCNDILAMSESRISLLATAFKDMFDAYYSIRMTEQAGIRVRRLSDYWHTGYIFCEEEKSGCSTRQSESDPGDVTGNLGKVTSDPDNVTYDLVNVTCDPGDVTCDSCNIPCDLDDITCDPCNIALSPAHATSFYDKTLFLNPAPPELLVSDRSILEEAVRYGADQAEKGNAFHPAVNRRIDELTEGYSSELQLKALINNIKYAINTLGNR